LSLFVQLLKDADDFFRCPGVEISRRLVGQEDRRIRHQRAGDGHALLLSARELRRIVVLAARESDALQRAARRAVPLLRRPAEFAVEQRQLDVLERRSSSEKVEALKDKSDLRVAD